MEEEIYSEEDWLDEIEGHFVNEVRQPGDLDKWQISKRKNVCPDTALRKMKEIARANPGVYAAVLVIDPDHHQPIIVLRKLRNDTQQDSQEAGQS